MRFGMAANSFLGFARLGHRHHVEQFLKASHSTNLLDGRQQRVGSIKATEGPDRLGPANPTEHAGQQVAAQAAVVPAMIAGSRAPPQYSQATNTVIGRLRVKAV